MSEKKTLKQFEELEYRDDFMFGKVMEDLDLCHDVLECLLGRPIGKLKEVQTQKEYHYTSEGKSIRMDVYNEEENGSVYDAEMENLNHRSVESHMLPKRVRYYQSLIDSDHLNKNDSYKNLPESTILFICTFDPFKRGLSRYIFCEMCMEDPALSLDDGTKKIFLNCTYDGDGLSEEILDFYHYVMTGEAKNDLTRKINDAVERGRKNEMWRSDYIKERVILHDEREEGREEERYSRIAEMLERGKTPEEIADFCGYSLEQVKEVQEKMLASV